MIDFIRGFFGIKPESAYDFIRKALYKEGRKRDRRDADEFVVEERVAVWRAARKFARKHKLRPPTMKQIMDAEDSAYGHSDFGHKWTLYVSQLLTK